MGNSKRSFRWQLVGALGLALIVNACMADVDETTSPSENVVAASDAIVGSCTAKSFGAPCDPDGAGALAECEGICNLDANGAPACYSLASLGLSVSNFDYRLCGTSVANDCSPAGKVCLSGQCVDPNTAAQSVPDGTPCQRLNGNQAQQLCSGKCLNGSCVPNLPNTPCSWGRNGCEFVTCNPSNADVCLTVPLLQGTSCDPGPGVCDGTGQCGAGGSSSTSTSTGVGGSSSTSAGVGGSSSTSAGAGGGSSTSTGVGGSASTGVGGSASTGVGGSASTGVGGSSSTGVGGSSSTGVGGSSSTGVGGSASAGVGGSSSTGVGGSSSTGVGGSSSTGVGGSASAGVGGSSSAGVGGSSSSGQGGFGIGGGSGDVGGAGGTNAGGGNTGGAGTGGTSAGGASTGTDAGGAGAANPSGTGGAAEGGASNGAGQPSANGGAGGGTDPGAEDPFVTADGGCNCRMAPARGDGLGWLGLAGFALLGARRRRDGAAA